MSLVSIGYLFTVPGNVISFVCSRKTFEIKGLVITHLIKGQYKWTTFHFPRSLLETEPQYTRKLT